MRICIRWILVVGRKRKLPDHVRGMLLDQEGNRNDIWRWNLAHRFCAQLPNGETNHAEGEALNTQQEIWMRYGLAEKCVIRSAHLKVLCVRG